MSAPDTTPLPPARVFASPTSGGMMRAYVQPLDAADAHTEVVRVTLPGDPAAARSGGIPSLGLQASAVSIGVGWIWIIGHRPVVKTRRVVGSADGTTFYVRSGESVDQFYFVGPPGSRVTITHFPAVPGRAPAVIDAANPYAECTSTSAVVRVLNRSASADAEFLDLVAQARQAAAAAGVAEH